MKSILLKPENFLVLTKSLSCSCHDKRNIKIFSCLIFFFFLVVMGFHIPTLWTNLIGYQHLNMQSEQQPFKNQTLNSTPQLKRQNISCILALALA